MAKRMVAESRKAAEAQLLPGEVLIALSDKPLDDLYTLAVFHHGSTGLALNDALALALFYYQTRLQGNKVCIITPDGGMSELRPAREVNQVLS